MEFEYNWTKEDLKKQLKDSRNKTNINSEKRPNLIKNKIQKKYLINELELGNELEKIGNDDLMFINDNLISNIRIESLIKGKKHSVMSCDNNLFKKDDKIKYISNYNKISSKQKSNYYTKNNSNLNLYSLDLNCNKMSYSNEKKINQKQRQDRSSTKNSTQNISLNKNKCVKNVSQFINKPSEKRKNLIKNILMSPINKNSAIDKKRGKRLSKMSEYNHTQQSILKTNNNNDDISIFSSSRADIKSHSVIRGHSMPTKRSNKNSSNLRLPNKSVIKNHDKILIELQKLFGEKIQLTEDLFGNMTDLDKKNCIIFLLETIKELNNINKSNKAKTDSYKRINEIKEQQIKDFKSEIKELKKEILKINKMLKKENQLNKKLIQNEENLKIQLEKEKMKNKILQTKVNSTSKLNSNFQNNKNKRDISVNRRREKSQDILIKANAFVNQKKNEKSKDKKIKDNSTILNNKNGISNIAWKNKEEKMNYNILNEQNENILEDVAGIKKKVLKFEIDKNLLEEENQKLNEENNDLKKSIQESYEIEEDMRKLVNLLKKSIKNLSIENKLRDNENSILQQKVLDMEQKLNISLDKKNYNDFGGSMGNSGKI